MSEWGGKEKEAKSELGSLLNSCIITGREKGNPILTWKDFQDELQETGRYWHFNHRHKRRAMTNVRAGRSKPLNNHSNEVRWINYRPSHSSLCLNVCASAHRLRIPLALPWFELLEISTGMGSNSSSLPFSPPDMRKAESAVKEEEVK